MVLADTLSRATNIIEQSDMEDELEFVVHNMVRHLAVSEGRKQEFRDATRADRALSEVMQFLRSDAPSTRALVDPEARNLWNQRDKLHEAEGLLFCEDKIIIPKSMRKMILEKLHESHLGIVKTKERARQIIFWPGMSRDIEEYILGCPVCRKFGPKQQKEPLMPHGVPSRAWKKVGCDLFDHKGIKHLLLMDYYSKFIEMCPLTEATAEAVIVQLKSIFSRHGIPEEMVADNIPFNSYLFKKFCAEWDMQITFSSPRYPQSNGLAESGVKIVKNILSKSQDAGHDPFVALLEYRNTPIPGIGYSPAQLLFSRSLRTKLPTTESALRSVIPKQVKRKLETRQMRQKAIYDRTARAVPKIRTGDKTNVRTAAEGSWNRPMEVRAEVAPRCFLVGDEHGTLIRNRRHLQGPPRRVAEERPEERQDRARNNRNGRQSAIASNTLPVSRKKCVVTLSGRVSYKPDRLKYTR